MRDEGCAFWKIICRNVVECPSGCTVPTWTSPGCETQLKQLPTVTNGGQACEQGTIQTSSRPSNRRATPARGLSVHDGRSYHPTENLPYRPSDSDCREDLQHPAPHPDQPPDNHGPGTHLNVPIECFNATFIPYILDPLLKLSHGSDIRENTLLMSPSENSLACLAK